MQLQPEKLSQHLKQGLASSYLVSGDEPLLVQEAVDAIRSQCRAVGIEEREVIDVAGSDDWQQLLHSAGSLSLFASRKLIEVRVPSGKPGAEGSKVLQTYLEQDSDDVLLIISGKIDKQSLKSKWYTALDRCGVVMPIWPVSATALPGWIQERIQARGMTCERDAAQLLADKVEGNLLAANQEIDKLLLLVTEATITIDIVMDAVADSARYDSFGLVDTALRGQVAQALRQLRGLRAEATPAPQILWALAREVRSLAALQASINQGQSVQNAMQQQGVWRSRMSWVQHALQRHNTASLARLQSLTLAVDGAVKSYLPGDPWVLLEQLVVLLAQGRGGSANTVRRA